MRLAWLCQIDAFTRADGAATTIRLASHDDDRLCHLNGAVWWPSIVRLPTFAYDFFDGAFGGEIVTPTGRAEFATLGIPGFAALMFHGARIRWWAGELGAAWGEYDLKFDGLIENQPAVAFLVASLDFRVDDRWLDDPLLATYAGTSGAEGEAAQKGHVKPLMLGAPRMVEGVLIDSIDTIVQLSDGPIEGVEVALEDAARLGAPSANYASFAALDAATIAPGLVATGLAVGLVRHGAPGDGVLTYDVRGSNSGADGGGWVRKTGAIIKRLAARQGKLAKVDTAALTALDAARPWNVSVPLTTQTTMREVAQALAQSINAVALVTWTGQLTILPIEVPEDATPVGVLASDGSALPPVAKVDQLGIAAPWWRVAIEAEVTHRLHSTDEIRFTANLVEVGIYDDAETYREGNIVSIGDGSRWLYVNATPSAGNNPSDVSAYWARLSDPTLFSPTDISPSAPLELPEGTLWIAPDRHLYRFGSRPWTSGGVAWTSNGAPWLGGGYSDAQDQAVLTAQQLAEAVTAQVDRIASDNWLTAGEKPGLILAYQAMIDNHAALHAKAVALGVAATERANATAAVNSLNAFLSSLSPPWDDRTSDTPISGSTLTSLWSDAANKVAVLQAAIQGLEGPPGDDGADGDPGLTISSSPPVFNVARTAGGAPKSGELPKALQVQVLDGVTDVTALCSFTKADTGCSVSNDGDGAFTLTSLSAEDAFTEIEASYGARTIPIKIAVAQPRDGSAASRASASVTSMNATSTYAAIATVDLVVPNGASVSGSATVTYLAASFAGAGTRTVRQQAKVSIQNLTDAGSEVDGTAQIGTAASYIGGDGPSDVGQVSASANVTNSTGATKTFRLKFYIRYYDGATTAQTGGGTYTGSIEAQAA